MVDAIKSKLKEEEWMVSAWSPVHLNRVLNQWYFKEGVTEVSALKVWQDSCQYLYLPRLLNSDVFVQPRMANAGWALRLGSRPWSPSMPTPYSSARRRQPIISRS